MFNKKLFRDKAMERFTKPEETDGAVQIITIRSWILLLLFILISFTLFFWLGFSNISRETGCRGLIVRQGTVTGIPALREGFIKNLSVFPGAPVKKGDFLADLLTADELASLSTKTSGPVSSPTSSAILSPAGGTVFEINVSEGDFVRIGDKLLSVEVSGNEDLADSLKNKFTITGFLSAKQVNSVRTGNKVLISPHNIDAKEFGYLTGTLTKIANYPVSPERKKMLVRENQLLSDISKDDYFEILITPVYESGKLKWTSARGASIDFIRTSYCTLKIITESKTILSFIFDK